MAVNSSANSVILILFAFSDNLSAENSKLSADSWNRGNHLFGCMHPQLVAFVAIQIEVEFGANASVQIEAGQEEKYKENLSLDRDSRKEKPFNRQRYILGAKPK